MKAAVFDVFQGPLTIRDVPDPVCPPDGAIIRVEACGVCRSDWHGWRGSDPDVAAPHVPGHEFAGVVVETGPSCRHFRNGDRVTAPFIIACGACPDCLGGDATVCNNQYVVGFSGWGAFAEMIAVPRADYNLVRLPDAMDFAVAAAMGCRLTTAFRGLVDRAQIRPGEWLAVHGCGGVGLSAIMIASAMGAQVLAVDVNDDALAMARQLGATALLNPKAHVPIRPWPRRPRHDRWRRPCVDRRAGQSIPATISINGYARHCSEPILRAAGHDCRRQARSGADDHQTDRAFRIR
jgi:alcohol dehydrogenase